MLKSSYFPFQPSEKKNFRLFCFPYAGAGASIFQPLRTYLTNTTIDILPIQLPGREDRSHERGINNFEQLIEILYQVVRPWLDIPCAFYGHCLGGLIAFALTDKIMNETGVDAKHVFMSGICPPQYVNRSMNYSTKDDIEFKEKLISLNGVPAETLANEELFKMLLPTLKNDFQLWENSLNYQYPEFLISPITAFIGTHDAIYQEKDIKQWETISPTFFEFEYLNGDHFTMLSETGKIADRIQRRLT